MHSVALRRLTSALTLFLSTVLLASCSATARQEQVGASASTPPPSAATTAPAPDLQAGFAALEARYRARLGVHVLDTGSGRAVAYRADERFAFASTGKALVAGVLLAQQTDAQLDRIVRYRREHLLSHAPVTRRHVDTGMSVRDLLGASLQYSDNTAANLLLDELGGTDAVERALRGLGDMATNVDRTEPALNTATPGDPRDTTTPRAIGEDLRRFVLADALPPQRRRLLKDLLVGNTTGGPYVRAGVPAGWTVADKTGAGDFGTRNDIAVVWPPSRAPLVVSLLSDRRMPDAPSDDGLLAEATRTALASLP